MRPPALALARQLLTLGALVGAGLAGCHAASAERASSGAASSPSIVRAADGSLPLKHRGDPTTAAISEADLMTRVYVFADDSMEGRRAGTPGHVRGTRYLESELRRLGLEPAGENGGYLQEVPLQGRRAGATASTTPTYNVIAVIRGSDPRLRGQYVAIGAHSDHVGITPRARDHDSTHVAGQRRYRASENSDRSVQPPINLDSLRALRPARRDSINNGADDDGSGSMGLLEIAEAIARAPQKPKRSILFVWHTAEELGMVGADRFIASPTVPLDSIVAQLNIDMIGRGTAADTRFGGPDYLEVVGSRRLSTELGAVLEAANGAMPRPLRFSYEWDRPDHPEGIYSRSDHYSYARRCIPIAFFFTGLHGDYHSVSDEPQYLDYPHYTRIVQFVHDAALRIANLDHRLVADKARRGANGQCQ